MEVAKAAADVMAKAHEELTKAHEELTKKADKLIKDAGVEVVKTPEMDPLVKAEFDKLEKRDKTNSDLIAKLLDEKAEVVYLNKVREFKKLPVKAEDFAPLLKRVAAVVEPADMDSLMATLKSVDEAISKGDLFAEIGSDLGGSGKGNAIVKIDNLSQELMKSDPLMTLAKAQTIVMEREPELYNQYLDEKK